MFGNERGYSLIELMLALTIIGLLAAVAAPKVSHVLAVSRTQKVAADLQMLDAAVMMYEAEKGDALLNACVYENAYGVRAVAQDVVGSATHNHAAAALSQGLNHLALLMVDVVV